MKGYCVKNFFVFLFFGFFVVGCSQASSVAPEACYQGTCFQLEVVSKRQDLMRGLQFRKSLDKNEGMLFVFSQSDYHAFWMKDTLIPLDMIWIDYAQRIVHIAKNVPPCKTDPCPSYRPDQKSFYVLEVNAGVADELGLKIGERIDIRL